mgnify:CR=1 FL=1
MPMSPTQLAALMSAFPGQWSSGGLLPDAHHQLRRVLDLWREAAGEALPDARALTPSLLKPVLPDVHIYDVRPEAPRYVVRLVGTRMTGHLGPGITGRPVGDIAAEGLRLAVTGLLSVVEKTSAPLHLKAPRAVALPNGGHRQLESLWLPCAANGAVIDRIVAVSLVGEAANA